VFEFHGEGCDVQPEIGIKQFNGLLDSIIYDARMAIEGMFHDEYGLDRDYSFDDVDFIYLAGAMSDHPHIREAFGKMCNKPIRISGDSETVVARGAALIDDKEITF
jgi:molecular chaperone DnaK (HSP70)